MSWRVPRSTGGYHLIHAARAQRRADGVSKCFAGDDVGRAHLRGLLLVFELHLVHHLDLIWSGRVLALYRVLPFAFSPSVDVISYSVSLILYLIGVLLAFNDNPII